jgi:hypothetical protein
VLVCEYRVSVLRLGRQNVLVCQYRVSVLELVSGDIEGTFCVECCIRQETTDRTYSRCCPNQGVWIPLRYFEGVRT